MKPRMRPRTAASSGSNQFSPRNGCGVVVAILSSMAWSPGGWQAACWVAFQSGDYAASKFPPSSRHDPFSHFGAGNTPHAVYHQNLFAASTISFNLAPGVALSNSMAAVDDQMARLGVPASIHATFQGT